MMVQDPKGVVVVGGGISGITAAVEIAETGAEVTLLERGPSLGGRVSGMYKYFPKLCPPSCGLEIQLRRIKANPRIRVLTDTEVTAIEPAADGWKLSATQHPRKVNDRCTACGDCLAVCPVERTGLLDQGLDATKAIYLPNPLAFPMRFAIDASACPGAQCARCLPACKPAAIDLSMGPAELTFSASRIVWATGWKPYDPTRLVALGFGRVKNVVTNLMFERLAASDGPTHGKLLRPSDRKEVKRVVFAQCAGSRDDEHLPYCSAVCCTASLKQACYVREAIPDSRVEIFYVDLRVGDNEALLRKLQSDPNVVFTRGKASRVTEDPASGDVTVLADETASSRAASSTADLVVLATGMVPESRAAVPAELAPDANGFLSARPGQGWFVAGCAHRPADVVRSAQDATGAGLGALRGLMAR